MVQSGFIDLYIDVALAFVLILVLAAVASLSWHLMWAPEHEGHRHRRRRRLRHPLHIGDLPPPAPYTAEEGTIVAASDPRASSAIAGYIQTVGIPFLATALPSQVCSSLQASSNATITLGDNHRSGSRVAPPLHLAGSSSLGFTVSGNRLEVEAWVAER